MSRLTLGVLSRSGKPNERRLPIHPQHLDRIDPSVRERIFLESGYGEQFGVSDARLAPLVGGLGTREELIRDRDIILLPKPLLRDVAELRDGQVLWGWPHCVQDAALTQLAIDKRLTLIAFEAMNHWTGGGDFHLHVLHKNNELAGYSSVLHALALTGSTGDYGRRLRATVIGFGATARGAVTALNALGVYDVTVLTNRDVTAVSSPIHSAQIVRLEHGTGPHDNFALPEGGRVPLPEFLAGYDIIVNCVLQDPTAPLVFLTEGELSLILPGSLVIDVSCDTGMGFGWATPTSFDHPSFVVGDNVTYYAVDHSPSYLWNSATWEISEALLPYLPELLGGSAAWDANDTLRRAIEIREGVIQNPGILAFQHRSGDYPHPRLS